MKEVTGGVNDASRSILPIKIAII